MSQRSGATIDGAFYLTVIFKGLGGLVELSTGILIGLVKLSTLQHWLAPLAHLGIHEVLNVSPQTRLFVMVYFSLRGAIRLGLAICLLLEQLWAYPAALIFLGGSIIYQVYLLIAGHFSLGLLGLTLFDGLIVVLTTLEYRKLRAGGHLHSPLRVITPPADPTSD